MFLFFKRILCAGIILQAFTVVMPVLNNEKWRHKISTFKMDSIHPESLIPSDVNIFNRTESQASPLSRENSSSHIKISNSTADPNSNKTSSSLSIEKPDMMLINRTGDAYPNKILRRSKREQNMHLDQAISEGFVYILNPFAAGVAADAIITEITNERSIWIGNKLDSTFFTDTYRWLLRIAVNVGKAFRGSILPGQIGTFFTTKTKYKFFPPKIFQQLTSNFINWTWEQDRFNDYARVSMTNFSTFDFQPRRIFNGWWSQEKLELRWVNFNG